MTSTKSFAFPFTTHPETLRTIWRPGKMIGVALAAGLLLSGCKPKADVE